MELSTEHYVIYSAATPEHTRKTGDVVEMLYTAYRDTFSDLAGSDYAHEKLKLKLFKDRAEFRRCNDGIGWVEAFYRHPYCCAYEPFPFPLRKRKVSAEVFAGYRRRWNG